MVTALKSLTGLNILKVELKDSNITITYEQITDDNQTVLVKRWLDLATVAMSFMEEPQTITINPVAEGTAVSRFLLKVPSCFIWRRDFLQKWSPIKNRSLTTAYCTATIDNGMEIGLPHGAF
jgi:hypothetical protein